VSLTSGTSATISVVNGQYSKDNGANYTSTSGTVKTGDVVTVRHSAASGDGQTVTTTLTIGNQTATFSSTTATAAVAGFSFTNVTSATVNTFQVSNAASVTLSSGTSARISVLGGEYSTDGGTTWTAANGTVASGSSAKVRHTSSANPGQTVVTTLVVGNQFATFASTTAGTSGTGDMASSFSFTPATVTGVDAGSSQLTSNVTATLSGGTSAPIRITGGKYSINGATATDAVGTVNEGDVVAIEHTASPEGSTTQVTTLVIGTKYASFASTTSPVVVAAFAFNPSAISATAGTTQKSVSITVSLSNGTSAPISVTGGSYVKNGLAATTTAGTVANGDTILVQNVTPSTTGLVAVTTVTIGDKSATFSLTPTAATTGYDFTFDLASGATPGQLAVSNAVSAPQSAAISVTNGEYSLDNGTTWTSATGTVTSGTSVIVRHTTSPYSGQTVTTTLTIGTWNGAFVSTST